MEDFGDSPSHLLDSVHATNMETLKFALVEMANVIARLTHSFQDDESLEVFKATLIENLIFEGIQFAENYPELLPNYPTIAISDEEHA